MRGVRPALVLSALVASATWQGAVAQSPEALAEQKVAVAVDAVETPDAYEPVLAAPSEPAMAAIVAEIETRMESEKDPVERAFLSQIDGVYRVPGQQPMWTRATGLTAAGEQLRDELINADRYGLDPAQFTLPDAVLNTQTAQDQARVEVDLSVSAVRYAWHAVGGRVTGSDLSRWIDAKPKSLYAGDVFRAIEGAGGDPVVGLRSFHPRHPQFERLRLAYLTERGDIDPAPLTPVPQNDERVDVGDRHPDVSIIRERLGAAASKAQNDDLLDRSLMNRIRTYMSDAGYGRKRYIDADVRAAIDRAPRPDRGGNRAKLDKFLVNLERWRTMPEDMGDLYVWNNLPEFTTRVVQAGEVLHEERIIIGKPHTQTPVFSDKMDHVIFQPEWGVPESIKIRSILPHLRGGDYGVLARRGMSIRDGKRVISPSRYKWSKVDIRNVPIIQGPGPGNPLGRLKFMFPNHHDVYMHDTPDKHLFNSTERTFSHGCIRVRHPDRFAEVILGQVQGWSGSDVAQQLKNKATTRIDLKTHIPVHNTYLTTWVNPDGKVVQFADIYSHDKRYSEALAGKSVKSIAARDPALALKRQNDEMRKNVAGIVRPKPKLPNAGITITNGPLFAPWAKQGLGNPPKFKPFKTKKYSSPAPPPKLLWFQQY